MAIAHGFKDIENRSWAPRLEPGELIAIHAGAAAPNYDDVERVKKRIGRRGQVPDASTAAASRFLEVVANNDATLRVRTGDLDVAIEDSETLKAALERTSTLREEADEPVTGVLQGVLPGTR